MSRVINLAEWRRRNEPDLIRLEAAVQRLDAALAGQERSDAPDWLVTEVLAIQGCISMDLVREAAERTERVLERWARLERRRGRDAG